MNLHQHLRLQTFALNGLVNVKHGELDNVTRGSLDWHVDGFTLGARADVAVAVVDAGQGTYATVDGANIAVLARFFRDLFHEAMHAFVGLVIIVNHLFRFLARDADALRKSEGFDGVSDGEVDDLGEAASLFQLLFRLRAKDKAGGALVDVIIFLKRIEHDRVVRDVREQAQLQLRVIGGDELVAFLGDEGAADATAQLRANRNIL